MNELWIVRFVRKDGKPDVGMSPMVKDDNVTPAKPAPVYELKYE